MTMEDKLTQRELRDLRAVMRSELVAHLASRGWNLEQLREDVAAEIARRRAKAETEDQDDEGSE